MKHFLAPHAGPVYWFAPGFSASSWPACQLRPMSSLFLLDVYGPAKVSNLLILYWSDPCLSRSQMAWMSFRLTRQFKRNRTFQVRQEAKNTKCERPSDFEPPPQLQLRPKLFDRFELRPFSRTFGRSLVAASSARWRPRRIPMFNQISFPLSLRTTIYYSTYKEASET